MSAAEHNFERIARELREGAIEPRVVDLRPQPVATRQLRNLAALRLKSSIAALLAWRLAEARDHAKWAVRTYQIARSLDSAQPTRT